MTRIQSLAQTATLFLIMTSCISGPKVPTGNADWRACTQEEDCMELRGYCNSPLAINKKFEDQYRTFKRTTESSIACENFDLEDWPEVYKVTCTKKVCQLSSLDDSSAPRSKTPFPKRKQD